MDSPVDFADLMRQVRAGDAEAAAKLIQHYDAELRIIARVRLNDPGLRRVMDSMDICQSVLANFFVRVSHGQFELDSPEQLLKLLASMIRNKVTDHARRQKADRRDFRRTAGADAYEVDVAGRQETPSQIVSAKELAQACHERFTSDERDLIEQRKLGRGWDDLGQEFGVSPDALRKKVTRAVDRVAHEVGLDESGDE